MPTLIIITDIEHQISFQSLALITDSLNLPYLIIHHQSDFDHLLLDDKKCYLVYSTISAGKAAQILSKLKQKYFILQSPIFNLTISQEIEALNLEMASAMDVSCCAIDDRGPCTLSRSYHERYKALDKTFTHFVAKQKEKLLNIEKICIKYAAKQNPVLLIGNNDLDMECFQQLKWFADKIQMEMSVIGESSILDTHDYLILNNRVNLSQNEQFKRTVYGHQISISKDELSNPDKGIHIWQEQHFDTIELTRTFVLSEQCQYPILIFSCVDNELITRADTVDCALSVLNSFNKEEFPISIYPYSHFKKRLKILLIGHSIIAAQESDSYDFREASLFSPAHYHSVDTANISEIEQQKLTFLAEKMEYHAGWVIEYFVGINNDIHIIDIKNGFDLAGFTRTSLEPIVCHLVSSLLEQYFNANLQTVLLNNINQINNGHQRFNLIAAYHMGIDIKPIDGNLNSTRLTYLNKTRIVSSCAYGEETLTREFKNKYISKYQFQQRLMKKYPEVVIPTVFLSSKVKYTIDSIEQLIKQWTFPLVIKPNEGISCDKLYIDLQSPQEILDAHQSILSHYYNGSLLQPKLTGKEYRVVLVDKSVVAVARKRAAKLTGDGKSTIQELIQQYNEKYKYYVNEECNQVATNFYIKLSADKVDFRTVPNIKIDDELLRFIEQQGLDTTSVLSKDDSLELLHANINGATWENAWGAIDEDILEKIREIHIYEGLKVNGADILITDDNKLIIFEFNCYPAIMYNHFILMGKPEPVIQSVYNYLFNMK